MEGKRQLWPWFVGLLIIVLSSVLIYRGLASFSPTRAGDKVLETQTGVVVGVTQGEYDRDIVYFTDGRAMVVYGMPIVQLGLKYEIVTTIPAPSYRLVSLRVVE